MLDAIRTKPCNLEKISQTAVAQDPFTEGRCLGKDVFEGGVETLSCKGTVSAETSLFLYSSDKAGVDIVSTNALPEQKTWWCEFTPRYVEAF